MLNIQKYKDEIIEETKELSLGCAAAKIAGKYCPDYKCSECRKKTMEWLLEEYKEPILTNEAKAYLKAILEPIEGCCNICKVPCLTTSVHELIFSNGDECASLKYKTGTKLYKYFEGLDYSKNYSPEELDL